MILYNGQVSQTKLLGICGKKQSGKNTSGKVILCNCLNELGFTANMVGADISVLAQTADGLKEGIFNPDNRDKKFRDFLKYEISPHCKLYSFAEPLKEFCINVLGLSEAQCYGTEEEKNSPTLYLWENMPGVITKSEYLAKKYDFYYHTKGVMTARDVMQYFGTEICRKIDKDIWVKTLMRQILSENVACAVITDCRFTNELDTIKESGGKLLFCARDIYKNEDTHQSEVEIDSYQKEKFDAIIEDCSLEEHVGKTEEILKEWGWV